MGEKSSGAGENNEEEGDEGREGGGRREAGVGHGNPWEECEKNPISKGTKQVAMNSE
jgi:hypothetical protein